MNKQRVFRLVTLQKYKGRQHHTTKSRSEASSIMKKHIQSGIIVVLAILLLSTTIRLPSAAADGASWAELAPMPTARAGLGVAVVNGKIYAIGGLNNNTYLSVNEEYDPSTNSWTTKAPMPTARSGFAIAVYDRKIYVFGGTTGDSTSGFSGFTGKTEVYDPSTNTWKTKASMLTPRADLSAGVVDGKIYLIGGKQYVSSELYYKESDVNEVYDPTADSWSNGTAVPIATFGYGSAVVDNKIYIIGGGTQFWEKYDLTYVTANQVYDPATDKWSSGATFNPEGSYMASAATSGLDAPKRIYLMGGFVLNDYSNVTNVYNPDRNSWSTTEPMPTPRLYFDLAVVNDMLYAIGGFYNDTWLTTNEQYTPSGYGTVPPQMSVLSPENKTYSSVPLTFTTNKATDWIGYSLDNRPNATITGNTTLSGLSQGTHSITIYANDSRGNVGSCRSATFSVDSLAPNIVILNPENKTYDVTDIESVFIVNEPVKWITYSLDGEDQVPVTGNVTLPALSEGSHSLTVYAEDEVGNIGTSKTIYFNIQLFPTTLVIAIIATAVIAAAGSYLFLKRRKTAKTKKV
jgi:N-acetylneuraminic acid mutarotase